MNINNNKNNTNTKQTLTTLHNQLDYTESFNSLKHSYIANKVDFEATKAHIDTLLENYKEYNGFNKYDWAEDYQKPKPTLRLYIDLETTGLHPETAELRLIQILLEDPDSHQDWTDFYIFDFRHLKEIKDIDFVGWFTEIFLNSQLIKYTFAHNAVFEMMFLIHNFKDFDYKRYLNNKSEQKFVCTQQCYYSDIKRNPTIFRNGSTLVKCFAHYGGEIEALPNKKQYQKGDVWEDFDIDNEDALECLNYAALDVFVLRYIAEQQDYFTKTDEDLVFKIDLPCIVPTALKMLNGVHIDTSILEKTTKQVLFETDASLVKWTDLLVSKFGRDHDVFSYLRSAKHLKGAKKGKPVFPEITNRVLQTVLIENGKYASCTPYKQTIGKILIADGIPEHIVYKNERCGDNETNNLCVSLDSTRYEHYMNSSDILETLCTYKKQLKALKFLKETLPKKHLIGDKIYTSYRLNGALTGRFTTNNPNLQSEHKYIRDSVRPSKPDYWFFIADYSQVEVRILAMVAKDKAMIEDLKSQDFHSNTARRLLGSDEGGNRNKAKAITFGVPYGLGNTAMAVRLGVKLDEYGNLPIWGKDYVDKILGYWFANYSDVERWITKQHDSIMYGSTFLQQNDCGRLFELETDFEDKTYHANQRNAVNYPIQSLCSEIMKNALVEIAKLDNVAILTSIHDEVLVEIRETNVLDVRYIGHKIKQIMEQSLGYGFSVNAFISKKWRKDAIVSEGDWIIEDGVDVFSHKENGKNNNSNN